MEGVLCFVTPSVTQIHSQVSPGVSHVRVPPGSFMSQVPRRELFSFPYRSQVRTREFHAPSLTRQFPVARSQVLAREFLQFAVPRTDDVREVYLSHVPGFPTGRLTSFFSVLGFPVSPPNLGGGGCSPAGEIRGSENPILEDPGDPGNPPISGSGDPPGDPPGFRGRGGLATGPRGPSNKCIFRPARWQDVHEKKVTFLTPHLEKHENALFAFFWTNFREIPVEKPQKRGILRAGPGPDFSGGNPGFSPGAVPGDLSSWSCPTVAPA